MVNILDQMLQPLPMDLSSDSDSDLSTIHEDYNEQEEALDEGLPPHLHWATAG